MFPGKQILILNDKRLFVPDILRNQFLLLCTMCADESEIVFGSWGCFSGPAFLSSKKAERESVQRSQKKKVVNCRILFLVFFLEHVMPDPMPPCTHSHFWWLAHLFSRSKGCWNTSSAGRCAGVLGLATGNHWRVSDRGSHPPVIETHSLCGS